MLTVGYTKEKFEKCRACSGTGRAQAGKHSANFSGLRAIDRALLLQGICVACRGKGFFKTKIREVEEIVGILRWIYRWIW